MSLMILNRIVLNTLLAIACFVGCLEANAQELATSSLRYQTPYSVAKEAIKYDFSAGSSLEQRRQCVLKAAEVAFGSNAKAALGNSLDVLARVPGGEKIARELAIMNRSNQIGALRAARVAGSIDADPRFKVVALEELVRGTKTAIVTDRDIVFRQRGTGVLCRFEVKNAKLSSQKSSLTKYKRQIDLMSAEQQRTGQPQAFVNRKPILPELEQYAKSKGVPVYGNVTTSETGKKNPKNISVGDVLDDIDRRALDRFRMQATVSGFGLVMAALEGRRAVDKWSEYFAGRTSAAEAGYHTLTFSSGASFAIGGVSSLLATQVSASGQAAQILSKIGRYGGPLGYVLMAGAFGMQGYRYFSGELNTRQFVLATSTTGGALAGGIAGAFGGGALGALGGPLAFLTIPAGAIVGGFAGAWAGQAAVAYGVESYFSQLDKDQQERLFFSLKDYYQAQIR